MMKKNSQPVSSQKLLILFLLISIITLPGCNLESNSPGTDSSSQENLTTESVQVHFSLILPSQAEDNETIALEILDEVTGLPHNSQLYPMQTTDGITFFLDLPMPTSSVVKYRYKKVGTSITPEITYGGDEVRYRLVYVPNETTVMDTLQGWQSTPLKTETGSISGEVLDETTQQPLADILISIGGNLTFTDANGCYTINQIASGVQNIVFYAPNGQYQTYQQGAVIDPGLSTTANVQLKVRNSVQVTFHVTTPNDALGIPVYLAGNLLQLGNTFADLNGGMSIKPKQMPLLTRLDDGTFLLTLVLYSGTDLRYKFTLGDGYWNAERTNTGEFNVRQLIVPDQDVTLELSVATWRMPGVEPVTFNITVPTEYDPGDEKYIQLKTSVWTEPLPLWPLGAGKYIYVLFSPMDSSVPISYRFCRNEDCEQALDAESLVTEARIQPAETAQSVQVTLTEWQNWEAISEPAEVVAANIPTKDETYQTWIELTPEMTPAWRVYAPLGITTLAEIGVGTVLVSPQWFISIEDDTLSPVIGETPFKSDLTVLLASINALGLSSGIFPRIGPTGETQAFWSSQTHSESWWLDWFSVYRQFILNYAQIAEDSQVEWFVIGGKDVMPAFPGGVYADGSASDVPDAFDDQWLQLISEIRSTYTGNLVWAANAQVSLDPLPHFVDMVDAVYISIDSPITSTGEPMFQELSMNFSYVLDNQVYEVYESAQKPVIVGLAYPSVESAASGCTLIDSDCSNDGVFLPNEIADRVVNLDEQVSIYNAAFPAIAERDWISGIGVRGYDPTVVKLDGSSSIAGKPALEVIWYWFIGLTTN